MPAQTGTFIPEIMARAVSPELLHEQMVTGEVLLLDYRANTSFNRSHIDGALNLTLPGLLLRRLRKGNVVFKCLIHGDEAKEKFIRTCKNVPVVLYDENSCDVNANSDCPFVLLLKRLKEDGYRVSYLQGTCTRMLIMNVMM